MKLASFKVNGETTLGAYQNGKYIDLHALTNGELPRSMIEFLEGGDAAMDTARKALDGAMADADYAYAEDAVELLSPVPKPGKIVHTSCNFDSHLAELATWSDPEWESHNWKDFHFEHPTGFLQAPSSVAASGDSIDVPVFTKQLDYEIEIGIIIGKEAFQVGLDEAFDYVAGYCVFNDLSARDIQAREHSNKVILMGKSFKGSCPLGPWLVTKDELDDPHKLDMKLRVNGEVRQDANTAQMHYKTAELVSWWSHMSLQPGDVITSGSPPGVAAGMEVPRWLVSGDKIEADVESLGVLTTYVA